MTYIPIIPQANDLISDSQSQILSNFTLLNSIFNNDHFTWNFDTAAKRGFHRQITFTTKLTADPVLGANDGILFPKQDANDTQLREQLYFINLTRTWQITNRFQSAASPTSGYWMLPGGSTATPSLIFMWGSIATGASGAAQVVLPTISNYVYSGLQTQGFPNNIFNVQITNSNSSAGSAPRITVDPGATFLKTSFFINISGTEASNTTYWFAIGN